MSSFLCSEKEGRTAAVAAPRACSPTPKFLAPPPATIRAPVFGSITEPNPSSIYFLSHLEITSSTDRGLRCFMKLDILKPACMELAGRTLWEMKVKT